jgi:AraC-like DNA-binding protein/mannose-6-phosphate isomerase-like protein (cupin superfamily)
MTYKSVTVEAFYESTREDSDDPFVLFPVSDFVFPPHFHYSFELLFVERGEYLIQVNNKKFKMGSGDIAVFAPGDIHSYQTIGSSRVVIFVFLENEFPELKWIFSNYVLQQNVFHFPNSGIAELLEKRNEVNDEALLRLYLKGFVNTLFFTLLKDAPLVQQIREEKERILRKVLVYVRQEFDNGINLQQTAHDLGLCSSHISRSFKKGIGCTFNEYVNQLRVEKAKRLLENEAIPIYEIVSECGFGNQRSLDRAFKKLTNMTPKEYRLKYWNKIK